MDFGHGHCDSGAGHDPKRSSADSTVLNNIGVRDGFISSSSPGWKARDRVTVDPVTIVLKYYARFRTNLNRFNSAEPVVIIIGCFDEWAGAGPLPQPVHRDY